MEGKKKCYVEHACHFSLIEKMKIPKNLQMTITNIRSINWNDRIIEKKVILQRLALFHEADRVRSVSTSNEIEGLSK